MTTTLHREKTSLRERVKEKFSSSSSSISGSIKLPKFLSNEPASPARYSGTPISPGYISQRKEESTSTLGGKEQWYFPPDPPIQQNKLERHRLTRSRDS